MKKIVTGFALAALMSWPMTAQAKFALDAKGEEAEVAFCKSLPRPPEVGPDIDIDEYCGCWIGSAENDWTEAEYKEWKAAAQNQGKVSPALQEKVKAASKLCIMATTPAK